MLPAIQEPGTPLDIGLLRGSQPSGFLGQLHCFTRMKDE